SRYRPPRPRPRRRAGGPQDPEHHARLRDPRRQGLPHGPAPGPRRQHHPALPARLTRSGRTGRRPDAPTTQPVRNPRGQGAGPDIHYPYTFGTPVRFPNQAPSPFMYASAWSVQQAEIADGVAHLLTAALRASDLSKLRRIAPPRPRST